MLDSSRRTLLAVVRAASDAGRKWAVVPQFARQTLYRQLQSGGWRVRHRRRFRLREKLKRKINAAARVFLESLRIRVARDVVVTRISTEGLLANFLHVLEVIHRVRPDAHVRVDWTLTGAETGFRYGQKGDDVWPQLFRSLSPSLPGQAHQARVGVEAAFWGTGKDYLAGRALQRHREAYHQTLLKWLEITNSRVLAEVNEICSRHFHGRFCIGVHRRVGNALVADLQADGRIPSVESIAVTVQSLISASAAAGQSEYAVFLATDDADAVGYFKDAFGPRLIVRENIKRTTSDATEVHFSDWGTLSITDAEDVLIDAVLLSQCNALVHASSSVSTVAALMSPDLVLVRA